MGKQSLRSQPSYIKISFHLSTFYRYLRMEAIESSTAVSHYKDGHAAVTNGERVLSLIPVKYVFSLQALRFWGPYWKES